MFAVVNRCINYTKPMLKIDVDKVKSSQIFIALYVGGYVWGPAEDRLARRSPRIYLAGDLTDMLSENWIFSKA